MSGLQQLQNLLEKISVSVRLQHTCLLLRTTLKQLHGSQSSPRQKVCVIPQADVLEETEEEGGKEEGVSQQAVHDWRVADIETDDVQISAQNPAEHLRIHFHCSNPAILKVRNLHATRYYHRVR